MNHDDTIVAVATPRGKGARGIVRLSGPDAARIVGECLEDKFPEGTYVRFESRVRLPDTGPFGAAVYVMRAPRSYTREDVVEIHAWGAAPLLAAIVEQVLRSGARLAEPGEFTRRAFLNGRIDLAQAEAVLAVIRARSDEEERLALSALGGNVSARVKEIRKAILRLEAEIEAGMDFSDEDISFASRWHQAEEVADALEKVRTLLEKSVTSAIFREEAIAVIYGPVNAGKSTLFNMLTGGDTAIVHEMPGTTRDILEAAIEIDGVRFLLVDTAGIRTPAEVVESVAIERTRSSVREAQVVLFVADSSIPAGDEISPLYAEAAGLPHMVVLNKSDKADPADMPGWRSRFGGAQTVEVSAATGAGREALERKLVNLVRGGHIDLSTARFLIAQRQRRHLEDAAAALERGGAAIAAGDGEELISLEIREAVTALGRVTGEDFVEDLLDEVFGRFCLGK